ncbi:MAG: hypothetical protein HC905_20535 [Bacteroidales bacterium]|nr:hypothetical protein [Bacteroidales bacterium]
MGYCYHSNKYNSDDFYLIRYGEEYDPGHFNGLNIEVNMPTRLKNLNLLAGSIFEFGAMQHETDPSVPDGYGSDLVSNGGGVYGGINPHFGGKHIGIDFNLAIGAFSYKIYRIKQDPSNPTLNFYDKQTSFGLGGISSFGLYLKAGRIGVAPAIQFIASGGKETSFLFYGITLPLTVDF